MGFQKATKERAKLRLGLFGPSGHGKTYTALSVGQRLAEREEKRVAFVDTERGSASKYAHLFDFDVEESIERFSPRALMAAHEEAVQSGSHGVFVVDSLSAFWDGTGGVLEEVDRITARSASRNAFTTGWREMTPEYRRMIEVLVTSPLHVIVSCRVKSEWVIERDAKGQSLPKRVGLQPVMRAGVEYEFDVVGEFFQVAELHITKSRLPEIAGHMFDHPGNDFADILADWVSDGAPPPNEVLKVAERIEPLVHPIAASFSRVNVRPHLERACRKYGAAYRAMTPGPLRAAVERAIHDAGIRANTSANQIAVWLDSSPAQESSDNPPVGAAS
ncbi:MAG: AAA family ATPase [Myxococcota bacterium]